MNGFLLDTNVVSELVRAAPEPKVTGWVERTEESLLYLSVLTIGEIRKGIAMATSASRRTLLESWLETRLRPRFEGRILHLDEVIADRWGLLAARAQLQNVRLPVIDGLLAATALQHNLMLVTRNTRDIAATGVPALNPWID